MTSVFSVFLNHCGLLFNDGILSETNIGNKMETTVFFLNCLADGVLKCGGVLGFCLWCFCWVCWFLSANHPLCNDIIF